MKSDAWIQGPSPALTRPLLSGNCPVSPQAQAWV